MNRGSFTDRYSGMPEYKQKQILCELVRLLHARRLIWQAQGSVSVRVGKQEYWITPMDTHPGLLSPDRLLRMNLNGALHGFGCACEMETPHHSRIYRQAPEARVTLVLAPVYWMQLAAQKSYPELTTERVDAEFPLCDWARETKILLHRGRVVCWSSSLQGALNRVDRMERLFFERLYEPREQASADELTPDKGKLLQRVINEVTSQLQLMGRNERM